MGSQPADRFQPRLVRLGVRRGLPAPGRAPHPERIDGQGAVGREVQAQERLRVDDALGREELVQVDPETGGQQQIDGDQLGGGQGIGELAKTLMQLLLGAL